MKGPETGVALCRLCRGVEAEIGRRDRYAHCARVARLAGRLAARHGLDPIAARTAGLLHDVARLWPAEALLAACAERGIAVDAFAASAPVTLHAPVGAALARERFGIDDAGTLQAIARHTVGAVRMEPLDAVVFVADALEPGRRFAERAALLDLAYVDLDAGLHAVYSQTREYLERRGLRLSPQLEAALAARERISR